MSAVFEVKWGIRVETLLSSVARPEGFREDGALLVGYARVSTREQNHALQLDALHAVGCGRVYTEKASGARRDRTELKAALDYAREGDTLVVWKLDRLARSIRQLIETVEGLERREIGLRSLPRTERTGRGGWRLVG